MAAQIVFILPSVGSKGKIADSVSVVCGLPRIIYNLAQISQSGVYPAYVVTDSDKVLSICSDFGIKAYRTYEDISNELYATEDVVKRLECIRVIDDNTIIVRIDPACRWVSKDLIQQFIKFKLAGGAKSYCCVGVKVDSSEDERNKRLMKVIVNQEFKPIIYSYSPIRLSCHLPSFYEQINSYTYIVGIDAFSRATLSKMFQFFKGGHAFQQAKDANIDIMVFPWCGAPDLYYDDRRRTSWVDMLKAA